MWTAKVQTNLSLLILLISAIFAVGVSAQSAEVGDKKKAVLIDEFGGRVGDCELGARVDNFFIQLNNNLNAQGYAIFYKGADALPAEMGKSRIKERFLMNLNFRRYDLSRVVMVDGGFRKSQETEFWLVQPGAEPPVPSANVEEPKIPTGKTFLYDKADIYNIEDLVLDSVKELEEEPDEPETDDDSDGESSDNEPVTDDDEELGDADAETEESAFEWLSSSFGEFLVSRPRSNAQIIFYADDRHYDIEKFRAHIWDAVREVEKQHPEVAGRIAVRFGGHRESAEAEFWIVPTGSKPPVATPGERSIDH